MSLHGVEEFLRPATVEEALAMIRRGGTPVAGGTDVILKRRAAIRTLVDLTALPIAGIEDVDGAWKVGANTTITDMLEHPGIAGIAGGVVSNVLRGVGGPALRNIATIGGHLARGILSDVIPVLLALDATVEYDDGEIHSEPLADFYASGRHRDTMVITAVTIPVPSGGAAYRKFSRTAFDIAILVAACRVDLDGGSVAAARIVVGETPYVGASLPDAEAALVGSAFDTGAIAAAAETAAATVRVGDDDRASAEYRKALTAVLVRRCLEEIAEG